MTLPLSGVMTANMINVELGRAGTAPFDINGTPERTLAQKPSGTIKFSDFYGKSASMFAGGVGGIDVPEILFSNCFQDAAGTVPVTAVGQPVGKVLDKSGNGNHLTQTNNAKRPTFGRHPTGGVRNLLRYSDTFPTHSVQTVALQYTLSIKGTGSIAISGTFTGNLVGTGANNIVSITFTPTAGTLAFTKTGTVTEGQFELGAARTAYQQTGEFYDVQQTGQASIYLLWFDGAQCLFTPVGVPMKVSTGGAQAVQGTTWCGFYNKPSVAGLNSVFEGARGPGAVGICASNNGNSSPSFWMIGDLGECGQFVTTTTGYIAEYAVKASCRWNFNGTDRATGMPQTLLNSATPALGSNYGSNPNRPAGFVDHLVYLGQRSNASEPFYGAVYNFITIAKQVTASELTNTTNALKVPGVA